MPMEDSLLHISNHIHNKRLDLGKIYLENYDISDQREVALISKAAKSLEEAENTIEEILELSKLKSKR
jgi:hypothetical protein